MVDYFKKLFKWIVGKTEPDKSAAEIGTAPLSEEMLADAGEIPQSSKPPQYQVGSGKSTGRQRDHDEDSLFTLTANLTSDTQHLIFGLYVVADGMGGHQHGEVASEVAARAISSYLIRKIYYPLFNTTSIPPEESLQEIMHQGVMKAHEAVVSQAPGGGTTLTAALILGERLTIAHVGDSRAYTISLDGRIDVLTRDHSLVKRLVELGQITQEEAAIHPKRNVLYRALGQGEPFEPDVYSASTPDAGYLLICSDGLWGVVPETEMFHLITSAENPQQACQNLIIAANEAGGPDNITAILIRMPH